MHDTRVSRRSFLTASAGLFLPRLAWRQVAGQLILCWALDDTGDTARESNSGAKNPIASRTGHAQWVGAGRDRALRLDGYSVWVSQPQAPLPLTSNAVTVCAWLALESYPVNEAAVVHIQAGPDRQLHLSIDRWGYSLAGQSAGASCKSSQPVPKSQWHHVAAVFAESETVLYLNGRTCGRDAAHPALRLVSPAGVTLGRSPDSSMVAGVFPTGVLNGLLRDVRVFDGQLSQNDLARLVSESHPSAPPDLQINGLWCADDPQRPIYHALPPRAWTNEPHGLIHWGGQYHLFYQKNPSGPYWGHIHWGHMTSPDLYRWTEVRVALAPEPGPDSDGCWSGSVIDHNGKLCILYTGGDGHRSAICYASSDEGVHFTKHPRNPVIAGPPQGQGFPEFRDPFVWREGETYYLIIGSAITGKGGTALLYRSKDLISWEFRKPLLVGDRETSGVFWEMPVFIPLGDQHALIVCEVPGRASWWLGTWKNETFTPHSPSPQRLELYNHLLSPTPHILDDGRAIAMGIIPDERSAKECWRAGWAHLYSLPRLITADAEGRLHQTPFDGIRHWTEPIISLANLSLPDGSMTPLAEASGTRLTLRGVVQRGNSRSFTLRLRASPDGQEHTDIRYHWDIGRLVLDRTHSSLDPRVKTDSQDATWFPDAADTLEFEVFLDESVLEVFLGRRSAFATRIYPTLDASIGILVGSEGSGASMGSVEVHRVRATR